MRTMVVAKLKPTARPASNCPLSTELMPPRIISVIYAALFKPKINDASKTGGILTALNNAKWKSNSCTTIGVPRNTATYTSIMRFNTVTNGFLLGIICIVDSKHPKTKPIKKPNTAISTVFCKPVRKFLKCPGLVNLVQNISKLFIV